MKMINLSKEEKKIIYFIKYTPVVLIIVISILLINFAFLESSKHTNKNIHDITENYTSLNKNNIKTKIENIHKYIIFEEKKYLSTAKQRIKQRVLNIHNIASKTYEQNKNTKSKEEILENIKYLISSLSLFDKGYFFIVDKKNIILHPHIDKLKNKKLNEISDKNGYKFIKTMLETIDKKTQRYDEYYWYKNKDESSFYKKISFYKYFESYNLIIGTGQYYEDLKEVLKKDIITYINNLNSNQNDIFLLDKNLNIISHQNKSLVGKKVSNLIENSELENIRKTLKGDAGYISYKLQTKNNGIHKKTSYIKVLDGFDWIIGTGYDDYLLSKEIAKKKNELKKEENEHLITIITMSVFLALLLIIFSLYLTKILEKRFLKYRKNIKIKEEEKEKELKRNAKIYEDLFEANHSIIMLINPQDGAIINANKKACEFYGYTRDKLLSMDISDINTLSKEKIQEEIEKALENGQGYFNFIHRLANGENRNVRVTSSISSYLDTEVIFSVINDVSKEYQIQDKLIETENEFKSLFEFSNIGLGIRDLEGCFIKVNKKLIDMLGYEEEYLLDKNCAHISDHEKMDEEIRLFTELLEKKIKNYNIEKKFIRKDGSQFEAILTMAAIYNNNDEIIYILSSIIDISEQKRKDNLLLQQSKMAAMGEMIGNIAHQWKQPLNLLSLSNGVIKINRQEPDFYTEEEVDDAVISIENAINHLSSTIDDFRNFFKPTKTINEFGIESTIDKTLKLTSAQFKARDIEIIKEIEAINLKTYENELIQVLMNILNNARDALDNNKDEKFIFINISKKENICYIKIKDNAGGIPEDIISKIFNPYFTTKDDNKGTGIGLYMSKEIIEKHINGRIYVNNIEYKYKKLECKGAEFTLEIDID